MVRRVENAARKRQDKSYDLVSSRRRWGLRVRTMRFGCEQRGGGNWLNLVTKDGLGVNIKCRIERIPFFFLIWNMQHEMFSTLLHIRKFSVPDRQLLWQSCAACGLGKDLQAHNYYLCNFEIYWSTLDFKWILKQVPQKGWTHYKKSIIFNLTYLCQVGYRALTRTPPPSSRNPRCCNVCD
jgi:hypothetical protein